MSESHFQTSPGRLCVTHAGSLPRSDALLALLRAQEAGDDVAGLETQVRRDLRAVVTHQRNVGVDVLGDGELPRLGFSFYVKDRMSGFGGESKRGTVTDFAKFPEYTKLKLGPNPEATQSATIYTMPECQSAVRYDPERVAVRQELALFREALDAGGGDLQSFVTAASPGIVSTTLLRSEANPDYASDRDYVLALADELRVEYQMIVDAGHILQIDAPDLALEHQIMFHGRPVAEFLDRVELHIEAINRALRGIPLERTRMHVCWGNWDGPHIDDIDLEPLLPLLLEARVGGLSLPFANPRHQHELKLFRSNKLPTSMVLIPGVVDVTTNMLEHPKVVADRLELAAEVVGDPARILAGTDCGFSTFAGYIMVAPDVAWEKLRVLAQGAELASGRLF